MTAMKSTTLPLATLLVKSRNKRAQILSTCSVCIYPTVNRGDAGAGLYLFHLLLKRRCPLSQHLIHYLYTLMNSLACALF